jgi:hypothetical protein
MHVGLTLLISGSALMVVNEHPLIWCYVSCHYVTCVCVCVWWFRLVSLCRISALFSSWWAAHLQLSCVLWFVHF